MSEFAKTECSVRDGSFVEPCDMLAKTVDVSGFSKAKGVTEWSYVNIKQRKQSRSFIGMRTKAFPDGVCFSFCPFCGTDISAPFDKAEAA